MHADPTAAAAPWWLYLLACEGGVYYAGIALDVERRFYQHLFGTGARFTRARPPLRIVAARAYPSRSEALRAELRLKALPRDRKPGFFAEGGRSDRQDSSFISEVGSRGAGCEAVGSVPPAL